jgi:hypothetical protein
MLREASQTTKYLAQSSMETERRFQDIEHRFKDTENRFKDLERRFRETDQRFRETQDLFTGQWGKLVEALMRPGLLKLFRRRGFPVNEVLQRDRVRRDGREMEIDVMLADDDIVIPVEVKTTLKVQDVKEFLERMEEFPRFFPKYRGYRVYGAVAGVHIEESADRYAYRQGLFVLTLGRNGLSTLLNDERFAPRDLAPPAWP